MLKKAEVEEQWSQSVQTWKSAASQLQGIPHGTMVHAEAQALYGLYTNEVSKSENNLQVALRFQPFEPSFFLQPVALPATKKCTYAVTRGNIRLDLFEGYDMLNRPDHHTARSANGSARI